MLNERKISCRVHFVEPRLGEKRFQEFEINEYPTYKNAFEMACNVAKCHPQGELVVFDRMKVTDALKELIYSDYLGAKTGRMSERLYLSNVRSLLNRLEEESNGFINDFDDILGVMIEETTAKLDELNAK